MNDKRFDTLMHVACVEWGFCGCVKRGEPLHVTMFIPRSGPVYATQFVDWLLLADNLNPNLPDYDLQKAALRQAFVTVMGGEVVDAAVLRWSDGDADADAENPDAKFRGRISDGSLLTGEDS